MTVVKTKSMAVAAVVLLLFLVGSAGAWQNPFQAQQDEARLRVVNLDRSASEESAEAEPYYNITLGTRFGIFVEPGIDPIDEFERNPYIYVTKKIGDDEGLLGNLFNRVKIDILHEDEHYPNGVLEFPCQLLVCEWKQVLSPGAYELYVQPLNSGRIFEPSRVTGSFVLEQPIIKSVMTIEGEDPERNYVRTTGMYFSITPEVSVYYTAVFNNVPLQFKIPCRLESKTVDRYTGESQAVFSFPRRDDTSFVLVGADDSPLVEIKNSMQSVNSTSAGNTYFAGKQYGYYPDPAFADLDGDGDLDMTVGVFDATFNYYENTGSAYAPVFVKRTGSANPFDGIDLSIYGCPWFADMDDDGDLDFLAGSYSGGHFTAGIRYFENIGSHTNPLFEERTATANPFYKVKAHKSCNPVMADMDNDGDLDLIFTCRDDQPNRSAYHKNIYYYQNYGTAAVPEFKYQEEFMQQIFSDIDYGSQTTIAVADLDYDFDLDLVVSDDGGQFLYFENMGTPEVPGFVFQTARTNPFVNFDIGESATPVFADLNGDGKPELVVGSRNGTMYCFMNGTQNYPMYHEISRSDSAFGFINLEKFSDPCFGDLDGDGDMDMVSGENDGSIFYFLNISSGGNTVFEMQEGANNPFKGINVGSYSTPYLGDVDGDGDLDMICGNGSGYGYAGIQYYENTGTTTSPKFELQSAANNPFYAVQLAKEMNPLLVDLDGDGDLDLTAGNKRKILYYYKNVAAPPSAVTAPDAVGAPFIGPQLDPQYTDNETGGGEDNETGNGDDGSGGGEDNETGGGGDDGSGGGEDNETGGGTGFPDNETGGSPDNETGGGSSTQQAYLAQTLPVYKDVTGSDEDPFRYLTTPYAYCTSTFGDTDKDGDLDLIMSDKTGKLYYAINTGTRFSPRYQWQDSAYNPLYGISAGGFGTPFLVDLNNDEILDIVCGNKEGEMVEIRGVLDTVLRFY